MRQQLIEGSAQAEGHPAAASQGGNASGRRKLWRSSWRLGDLAGRFNDVASGWGPQRLIKHGARPTTFLVFPAR